ncbi:ECF transporter S component [uncultured Clostridium sp.]|uniref:ECF transporter S component n=1 Tax=uncultured Clostridium sp. TaxID=59620 RepID=UPI0025EFD6CF|nr:ECF transporter S component [uncultured Clostridium sp.]
MQNESVNIKKINFKKLISYLIIVIVIPLTILFGAIFLQDKKYYFISLLVIIYSMIPFLFLFEKSKPKAREIVLIAVMSAIAVVGRAAFFMIPQFKPVVAIVIITGVSLGAEAGFLTGAIAGFVSNFFFGQGPWTPWQMFCFGIIGFLAGILFEKNILKKNKLTLCIFGGLTTLIVYGGIINFASLLMMTSTINMENLIAIYASGLPFDVVHAFSTVVFLFLISNTMLEKLDRVKNKYGII